jgi:dTDP-glucose 4,6-dehydratase
MDGRRLTALGWQNRVGFEDGLAGTVDWYRDHVGWWEQARSGDWEAYYERQYGDRLAASAGADAP